MNLEYLESTLAAIETSDTESDLNAIRAELIAEGYLNRKFNPKKQKQNASKPMHFVSSDGFDIYVGKNNTQNDYLTLNLQIRLICGFILKIFTARIQS